VWDPLAQPLLRGSFHLRQLLHLHRETTRASRPVIRHASRRSCDCSTSTHARPTKIGGSTACPVHVAVRLCKPTGHRTYAGERPGSLPSRKWKAKMPYRVRRTACGFPGEDGEHRHRQGVPLPSRRSSWRTMPASSRPAARSGGRAGRACLPRPRTGGVHMHRTGLSDARCRVGRARRWPSAWCTA